MLIQAGEMDAASSLVEQIEASAEMTGSRLPRYAAIALAARRAQETEDATHLLKAGIEAARARGEGLGVAFLHWETAFLANGLGRYDDALAAARLALELPQGQPSLWIGELLEAAARSEGPEQAADALRLLSDAAEAVGTDWVAGVEARSRALLSAGPVAEALYMEAIGESADAPPRHETS